MHFTRFSHRRNVTYNLNRLNRVKIHMAFCGFKQLSRLQLASANRVAALTSRDGILWVQGIPDVKKRYRESIENAYYRLNKGCRRDKFVIRSVTDVIRTQSRFVGLPHPPQILQTYFGPKVRQKQTL